MAIGREAKAFAVEVSACTATAKQMGDNVRTAADYIQGGLIAMYDGIENAGLLLHNASATAWKDLSGNGKDAAMQSIEWAETSARRTTSANVAWATPLWGSAIATMEAVVTPQSEGIAFVVAHLGTRQCIGTAAASIGVGLRKAVAISPVVGVRRSISAVYPDASANVPLRASIDGTVYTTYAYADFSAAASAQTPIGYGYNSREYLGDIHCIRIYNRPLTAEEVAHNYAVDKARYGLD